MGDYGKYQAIGVLHAFEVASISPTMTQTIKFVFLSCTITSALSFFLDSNTDICRGLDCPKYTLLNVTKDWQFRRYDAIKWVATKATAMHGDEVRSAMFRKLFNYISGANIKNETIEMTAPVATTVTPGICPNRPE